MNDRRRQIQRIKVSGSGRHVGQPVAGRQESGGRMSPTSCGVVHERIAGRLVVAVREERRKTQTQKRIGVSSRCRYGRSRHARMHGQELVPEVSVDRIGQKIHRCGCLLLLLMLLLLMMVIDSFHFRQTF